jgi:biotin operon repressor
MLMPVTPIVPIVAMVASRQDGLQIEPSHRGYHVEPDLSLNTQGLESE